MKLNYALETTKKRSAAVDALKAESPDCISLGPAGAEGRNTLKPSLQFENCIGLQSCH